MLAADQTDRIKRSLDAVATALLQRGFQRVQRSLLSPEGQPSDRVADVWLDPQGHPQGGWSLSPPTSKPGGVAAVSGGRSETQPETAETDGPTAASP